MESPLKMAIKETNRQREIINEFTPVGHYQDIKVFNEHQILCMMDVYRRELLNIKQESLDLPKVPQFPEATC